MSAEVLFIPYGDLKRDIRRAIWPNGEAENLVSAHDDMFLEGMNEIQKWVDGQQDNNVNTYPACTTKFRCGMTIIPAARGYIHRVYTIANDLWCDPVFYFQTSWPEPEIWSRNLLTYETPLNVGMPRLPMGTMYAEASTDSVVGRSRAGIWALNNNNIVLSPWIQSNETIVVEWKGRKYAWADSDQVDADNLVKKTLKLYVQWAHERDFGCDREKKRDARVDYDVALADLIHEDREQKKLRKSPVSNLERTRTNAEILASAVPEATDESIDFAVIGSANTPGDDAAAVATLVKSWSPGFIVSTGNTADGVDYDAATGQYYSGYLYPYSGAYGEGASTNAFWPVPSAADWDGDGLVAYKAFFNPPENKGYYELCVGLCHFFFMDSDYRDPDGNLVTSPQMEWLKVKLLLSTAKWKIVVMYGNPYSSVVNSGQVSLRLPFKDWGADVLITGGAKVYERLEVNEFPYIVNGLGGSGVSSFGTPLVTSQSRYVAAYGAMQGSVSEDELSLKFYNVSGTLIDTLTIEK